MNLHKDPVEVLQSVLVSNFFFLNTPACKKRNANVEHCRETMNKHVVVLNCYKPKALPVKYQITAHRQVNTGGASWLMRVRTMHNKRGKLLM